MYSVTTLEYTLVVALTEDDGIFQTNQRVPNRIQAE